MSIEDELEIALCVEDEAVLEEALQADIETSVEMPFGKIKDLPPPPSNQKELAESPFREAFEHSQRVELKGLFDAGCFVLIDKKYVPKKGLGRSRVTRAARRGVRTST